VLAYRSEQAREQSQLTWFERTGKSLGAVGSPAEYRDIALSPDGSRIAMSIVDAQKSREDLWVLQIARGVLSRLTFDDGIEMNPVWSPDGERVAYTSDRSGSFRTYTRFASGAGVDDSIPHAIDGPEGPSDWSHDGRTLLLRGFAGGTGWDIWMAPVAPIGKAAPFMVTTFSEPWARFSPDGRWVAYQSNQSGRNEIYVQASNGAGGKWQISSAGGAQPWWRRDGREIFYRAADQTIVAMPVTAGATFDAGTPLPLFKTPVVETGFAGTRWVPSADGQRFLVNLPLRGPERPRFTVVTNWTAELKRR
jgi:Tol biopolymer transport system component